MPEEGWSSISVPDEVLEAIKELIKKRQIRFKTPSGYITYVLRKETDLIIEETKENTKKKM